MSYDLIFWRGRPTQSPTEVWEALYRKEKVRFVTPLTFAEVLAGFRGEFGDDLQIDEEGGRIEGRGWEAYVRDGDYYVHVSCAWRLAEDHEALDKLRRAAVRACCNQFDPQTCQLREGPAFREADLDIAPAPAAPFAVGDGVHHQRFGAGSVLAIDGAGDTAKVRVKFAAGEKVLIARVLSGDTRAREG